MKCVHTDKFSTLFALVRTIDVGERAQTKPIGAGRVAAAVDVQVGLWGMKRLADVFVRFVIGYGAPERRLYVFDSRQSVI